MRHVGKWTLMVLGAAVAALPLTGGVSVAVAVPIAVLTGQEVAVILAVFVVGLTLLRAVDEGYDIIIERDRDGNTTVTLSKKDA